MDWQRSSKYSIRTPEGYAVARFTVADASVYVAWAPNVMRPLYVGPNADDAKGACSDHMEGGGDETR